MATSPLRWGLLSTANINRAVITPLRSSSRNKLMAVASRDGDKARAYAREWNIPRAFDSYEAMLADPDIDVVYISLPNALHAPWTVRAAEAGKHVLCEKPLAVTLDQVDEVKQAGQRAGVVIAEAFMYRHHPQTLKVKELVNNGSIGSLQTIRGSFSFPLTNQKDVRLDLPLGGGSIWDIGCYPISYARTMAGKEPVEVFGWQETGPSGVDVTFVGQMRFPDNVYAQFDCSFRAPERMHIEIIGTDAAITIPSPFKPGRSEQLRIVRRNEEGAGTVLVSGQELYLGEVEDMADCVLLGKTPRVTLDDSRNNVATILALLQSAREGKPVQLGA